MTLRVKLELLLQKRLFSSVVGGKQNELDEGDERDENRRWPVHDLLASLHDVQVLHQLSLPANKMRGIEEKTERHLVESSDSDSETGC